jgi:hypothetical protein
MANPIPTFNASDPATPCLVCNKRPRDVGYLDYRAPTRVVCGSCAIEIAAVLPKTEAA